MGVCKKCGGGIDDKKVGEQPPVFDEYEREMRIDEIVSLLPFDDDEDEDNNEFIDVLCEECTEAIKKILNERIAEELEFKKCYEEFIEKEEVEEKEETRIVQQKEENDDDDDDDKVCADQSKSPAPCIDHNKDNLNNSYDNEYKAIKGEYAKKKKELKDVLEEKQKCVEDIRKKVGERNVTLCKHIISASEQCYEDEMQALEKDLVKYNKENNRQMSPFNYDRENATINGYRIYCADKPCELSAAIGLCAHMLYKIYKITKKGGNSEYTLIPNGPTSTFETTKGVGDVERKLYVTEDLVFFQPGGTPPKKQLEFEEGIDMLSKDYFEKFCEKRLTLRPSKLTKEQWMGNMKVFLEETFKCWERAKEEEETKRRSAKKIT